ncbi:HAD-like domain-containing protein [Fimicolochytrium jonesii]|uniref:HAD-like domain-containing protein n=1 Tax=Fimicolochytrium jonesii TaxID=1396493 RepID=UPI0022FE2547|nr:HAD-like domain-containing protein [Fimicolochytrium jonesii]KAI8827086.1 HAD-like domain-containing protein [Fimicolochytrium jonesii]
MKFGKYLTERRSSLSPDWSKHCVDYVVLKTFIKEKVKPRSLNTLSTASSGPAPITDFAGLFETRAAQLQPIVAQFLRLLDKEVNKFADFYESEAKALTGQFEGTAKSNGAALDVLRQKADMARLSQQLQDVVRLEKFVFLNYTGITKILKKNDRHSGFHLAEQYIRSMSTKSFYRSETLSKLKQQLIDQLSGVAAGGTHTSSPPASPVLTRQGLSIPGPKPTATQKDGYFPPSSLLPQQKLLVTMAGPHGTDIIDAVLENLATNNCEMEDFVLSRLYHNVTFGCLIRLRSESVNLFKDLAESARKWDATLFFDVQDANKGDPVESSLEDAPYKDRIKYTATVLNQNGLSCTFLHAWTRLLLDERISVEKMTRLSAARSQLCSVEYRLSVPPEVDFDRFRGQLFQLSMEHGTDVAIQLNDVYRSHKRLVIFDMDSTLIQQEVIDEIAKHAGVVEEVAKITEQAMNGEIDFKESLRRRVRLLKGTPVSALQTVKAQLTFTEGAHFLCKALKKLGFKLAVISGGFMPLALHVKNQLGLDYAFANQLKVSPDGQTLTGETHGPIVDGMRKAELLDVIAQAESIGPEQVIAVGDGANDLWMLAAAGLGIAFNAKPKVQKEARARINQTSLRNVLYLLGYTDDDARQLAEL